LGAACGLCYAVLSWHLMLLRCARHWKTEQCRYSTLGHST
jgi:hypothetical protein